MKYITEINRYSQPISSYDQLYPITKLENVIGLTPSLGPQIIVTADTGSIVTCSDGVTTLTGISDGSVTFDIPNWGAWAVKGEKDGSAIGETEVVVNSVQVYEVTLGDPHTLLLLHGESIVDSSKYHVPLTNHGVVVSTAQSKFGGKSLYFNGKATIEASIQSISGDMTFDFWANLTSLGINAWYSCFGSITYQTGQNGAVFQPNYQKTVTFVDTASGRTYGPELPIAELNVWHHYAIIRADGMYIWFIDGKKIGEVVNKPNFKDKLSSAFIGRLKTNAQNSFVYGFMDEIRVSDIARWTSDFTPPTKPYS